MRRTAPLSRTFNIQTLGIKELCLQVRQNGRKDYTAFSLSEVGMAGPNGRTGLLTVREATKRYPEVRHGVYL